MNTSVFEVVGPIMVGPSSSHTAGAARLARVARLIAQKPFKRVSFGLHGSFAQTYKGHGTDRALLAGALGLAEDDERLANAFTLAEKEGLEYEFYEIELEGVHENTVCMRFYLDDGTTCEVVGSSVGGGQIRINSINGFETGFSAQSNTLVIRQSDTKGVLSETTRILAEQGINIGVMRLSRKSKGGIACCIIEVDDEIPAAVVRAIENAPGVYAAQAISAARPGEAKADV